MEASLGEEIGRQQVRRTKVPLLVSGGGALLSVLLASCVTTTSYRAQPVHDESKVVTYSRGVPITTSRIGESAVAVAFMPQTDDGRIIMLVSARNYGQRAENFGSENISLTDGAGRLLRVWNADDLILEASSKADGQKTMLAIGAVLGAASSLAASYSTTTGAYTSASGGGTFQSTTYDPSVALAGASAAGASALGGMGSINAARDDRIALLRRSYLQTNTIGSGQQYQGLVIANAPPRANETCTAPGYLDTR